jgi:hypothetical protein
VGWLREGKSNYEAGCILGISALTVKNHLPRIYRTLGVSNRTHALARCLSLQLLQPAAARARLAAPYWGWPAAAGEASVTAAGRWRRRGIARPGRR